MNITLKKKKLQNGRYSLFLEYYKGSTQNSEGKRIHLRDFEYLKLYPHQEPKTAAEKKENKEIYTYSEQTSPKYIGASLKSKIKSFQLNCFFLAIKKIRSRA